MAERNAFRLLEQLARKLAEAADRGDTIESRWEPTGGRGVSLTVEIKPRLGGEASGESVKRYGK